MKVMKSNASVCFIISAIICFVLTVVAIVCTANFTINDGIDFLSILLIAFTTWLIVNLSASIYAVVNHAQALHCYLLISELLIAIVAIGTIVISTIIYIPLRHNCHTEYCPLADILYVFVVGLCILVGVPEVFLMNEARKCLTDNDSIYVMGEQEEA